MSSFSARSTFKEIRNFLAGRFMGATRDEFFLDEIVKLIFCKFEMGSKDTSLLNELEISSLYRKAFRTVVDKHADIYGRDDVEIELDPISIKYIDEKLHMLDIDNLGRDIIGDAYEIFIGDAIKGQSGQFFTPQNAATALVEMIQPAPDAKILDLTCGAGGFLIATLKYWIQKGIKYPSTGLYGVDKDEYLTRLCKIHLACMGYDTTNIRCADSLLWDEHILGPKRDVYDIILTNPPFGVNIQAGSSETLCQFELAYKHKNDRSGGIKKTSEINLSVAPQVVFTEQCINLIKPGGFIGIVIPESLISNKKYTYVVRYLLNKCRVHAVIGMPDALFKTSGKGGTHTKTCLLVLQKKDSVNTSDYGIFMAEARWCGHDSRGREIPNDDIPGIVENYLAYKNGREIQETEYGYVVSYNSLRGDVLAPRAYAINDDTTAGNSEEYDVVSIGQLIKEGVLSVSTGNELGKLAYGTGDIPFVRTSDISNWEIKSDPKHLVSQEIYESLAKKQDVRAGDILMVKDGSYLIGTCAMITQYDTRMIYQSHLYKIRVNEQNRYGLDNYYLLATLSSDFLRQQVAANTYSHDIINSLGDRLKDLLIPISKSNEKRASISEMVRKSIQGSIEARELAKRARATVLCDF